eukprot:2341669-Prymnesium_polylepis.1
MHTATLYAAASLVACPPSAAHLAGAGAMYSLLTFGITGGHHRYFSHRSYKTSRAFQFGLAVVGCLAWQRGPMCAAVGPTPKNLEAAPALPLLRPLSPCAQPPGPHYLARRAAGGAPTTTSTTSTRTRTRTRTRPSPAPFFGRTWAGTGRAPSTTRPSTSTRA